MEVRRLRPGDDRSSFRSGNLDLDRFFERYAGQNQFRHHIGTTYVAVEEGVILGFATVAPSEIAPAGGLGGRGRRLPRYPLPVLRLARLAVDERAQGRGLGRELLRGVFALAQRMAQDVGCVGIVVDAKPEAIPFYRKLGFLPLEAGSGLLGDRPLTQPMFLELGALPKP